jgi:hypothetical protein
LDFSVPLWLGEKLTTKGQLIVMRGAVSGGRVTVVTPFLMTET